MALLMVRETIIMQAWHVFPVSGAAMTHGADIDRPLPSWSSSRQVKGEVSLRAQKFEILQRASMILTGEWAAAFPCEDV